MLAATYLVFGTTAHAAPEPGAAAADDADRLYCLERKLGTWFYCRKPKTEPPEQTAPSPAPPTAAARLEAITAQLRELKAKAILEPSTENVIAYIRFQRAQLDRSSMFSDVWQRALWQGPELDYTLELIAYRGSELHTRS